MSEEIKLTKAELKLMKRYSNIGKFIQFLQYKIVNPYVRERDMFEPCISCGRYVSGDAGHYIAISECERLRFDLRNIWKQCGSCNRYRGGMQAKYRMNLVERIGEEEVDDLEYLYRWYIQNTEPWGWIELIMKRREVLQKKEKLKGMH